MRTYSESPHGKGLDSEVRGRAIVKGRMAGGEPMAAEGHGGPGAEPTRDSVSPQPSTPKPAREQGSWAADNIPVIILALLVLVLGIAGAVSNDSVTCPGGATSCGTP